MQVYNLGDLKEQMKRVLDIVDHKNLDKDVDFFSKNVSSTENLVVYLWQALQAELIEPKLLYKMVLHETSKNSVTYFGN